MVNNLTNTLVDILQGCSVLHQLSRKGKSKMVNFIYADTFVSNFEVLTKKERYRNQRKISSQRSTAIQS